MNSKYLLFFCILAVACNSKAPEAQKQEKSVDFTPVTVTQVATGILREYIELNATSVFLQKNYVKANASGYIKSVATQPGKYVMSGTPLFAIKTKEAQSIGNSINNLDPSFKFSGENSIKASGSGYITQLNHQAGDYVQDGEQLAVISNISSFAFLLDVPYEFRQYVALGKTVDITLPDNTHLTGIVAAAMPTVDPASQTQSMVVKVSGSHNIPENLVAKVKILKAAKDGISVPKAAILSNDIQTDFWVMLLTDATTAVKVAVKKGMEANGEVEILSPSFSATDKVLVTGNYGLPDTAKVKIVQP